MDRLANLVVEASHSAASAVAIRDAAGETTFADLHQSAAHVAQCLQKLGVEAGDRVGIWLPKSAQAVAAVQAALRRGAAYVPLDPDAPVDRIQAIAASAGMKVIVTSNCRSQRLVETDRGYALLCVPQGTPSCPPSAGSTGSTPSTPHIMERTRREGCQRH